MPKKDKKGARGMLLGCNQRERSGEKNRRRRVPSQNAVEYEEEPETTKETQSEPVCIRSLETQSLYDARRSKWSIRYGVRADEVNRGT
jgi:hypothetical protein